ncbi:MAG: flagellar basal body-associated FliL family protein [Clostridiales bacterium]|jgi:flagellar basal body-associated protein FliL|nr:flagellar basal body-associated FliL family protein [Clostridiales bacterium]
MDKSKLMMMIIIALLVLLLGTVVGVGVWLIGSSRPNPELTVNPAEPITTEVVTASNMRLVSLNQVVANLALGPNGRSDSILAEVVIGINDTVSQDEVDAFETTLTNRLSVARNDVFNIFGVLTYDEVRTVEGRAAAAEMIKVRLQESFESNLIVAIYFNEWNVVRGQ